MIDPFPIIALPKFLPYQPSHHTLDPLFPYNGILGSLQPRCIREVYSIEGGGDFGLFRHGRCVAAADVAATDVLADEV